MFKTWRDKAIVKIWFKPHENLTNGYNFTHEFHNELDAETYLNMIDDKVAKHVATIRENAYLAGFRDAKAKKAKRKWFSNCFNYDGRND